MHYYLHLNLGGNFYRSSSGYGMLILSLAGNRIRNTPDSCRRAVLYRGVWRVSYKSCYIIIHAKGQKVNAFLPIFYCFLRKIVLFHAKINENRAFFPLFGFVSVRRRGWREEGRGNGFFIFRRRYARYALKTTAKIMWVVKA